MGMPEEDFLGLAITGDDANITAQPETPKHIHNLRHIPFFILPPGENQER